MIRKSIKFQYLIILAMFEEFIRIEYLRISNSEIFDDYIRKYIKRLKDKNITNIMHKASKRFINP